MYQGYKPKHLSFFPALLIAALLVSSSLQTSASHDSVVSRAQRILQTTGYKVVADPAIKRNCDDQGIAASSLAISVSQRDEEQSKFIGAKSSIVDSINSSSGKVDYMGMINKAVAGPLGASAIFFVLSLLSLFFLFFWSLFECCCKKTCCIKQEQPGEGRSKARIICWIIGAVIGIVTVVVVIAWVAMLGKLAGGAKDIKCGISIFYSDIVKGTVLETGGTFAGTTGLSSLLTSYISFIDGVPSIQSDATSVKNQGLDTKGTSLITAYNSFKSFDPTTYRYIGSKTGTSAAVTPNVATSIKGAIDSKSLEAEAIQLNATAFQIHTAVSQIASYSFSGLKSVKSNFVSMNNLLGSSLQTPITNMYNSIAGVGSPDYAAALTNAVRSFMIVSIIVVILFTIIYLVILYFTAKLNRFHALKVISKIIMLVQLVLGTLILVFAIIGSIFSVIFIVACAAMDGIVSTEGYMSKFSSDQTLTNIMSNCVYKTAGGDLLKALGADLTEVDKISTISTGMQSFQNISSNLTSQSAPYIGGAFDTSLTKYVSPFDSIDRGTPNTDDVQEGIDYFNSLVCSQDKIGAKASAYPGATESTTTDTKASGVGSPYIITFSNLPGTVSNYNTRYSTACTGVGGLSATDGGAQLQKSYNTVKEYISKYSTLQTNYKNNFYTAESALFTSLKTSLNSLNRIDAKISDATKTLGNLGGTFQQVADCTVMRKQIILVQNVLCFRVGSNFIVQNNLAVAVGVFIFVYTWFICCGIRLATKREDSALSTISPNGAVGQPLQGGYMMDHSAANPYPQPPGGKMA